MRGPPLLLFLVLLTPLAAADEDFSHRVYVMGRVIDAEGRPAAGLPVEINITSATVLGQCLIESRPEVTDARGDYRICRHVHEMPTDAIARIAAGGAVGNATIDRALRYGSVDLRLPGPAPARDLSGERRFAQTFTVAGRAVALGPEPAQMEGVEVPAAPLYADFEIALIAGDEVLANATTRLDIDALYLVDLDVGEIPAGALVRLKAGPDIVEHVASAEYRRADMTLVRDLRLIGGPGTDAPGGATPIPAWLALVALAGLALTRRNGRSR